MAGKLTQADFLAKSKFKVFVPEDVALRLSPTAFNEQITALFESDNSKQDRQNDGSNAVEGSKTLDSDPKKDNVGTEKGEVSKKTGHPFVDALEAQRGRKRRFSESDLGGNQMLTENSDIAYQSSRNSLVDLFYELEDVVSSERLTVLLENAWKTNTEATLRLIWNSRSIHLGKSSRTTFYRCCGWLAEKHPATLVANLQWLTRPIIPKKVVKEVKKDQDEDEFEVSQEPPHPSLLPPFHFVSCCTSRNMLESSPASCRYQC